jgi:hypothetical protein
MNDCYRFLKEFSLVEKARGSGIFGPSTCPPFEPFSDHMIFMTVNPVQHNDVIDPLVCRCPGFLEARTSHAFVESVNLYFGKVRERDLLDIFIIELFVPKISEPPIVA